VVLRWEAAYGQGYRIQVSNSASTWSDVYSTTVGDGGVDDILLSTAASGRYVRMLGSQRGTAYGYSLYEFEVYGGGGTAEVTVLGNSVSIADGDTTPSATDHTDFGSVVQGSPGISRTFTVRNDGTAALMLGTVTLPTGFTLAEGLSSSLAPGASDTFTVQLDTTTVGTKTGDISFTTNDGDENPFDFTITGIATETTTNLAWQKPTSASTNYTGYPAANATDGDWSSRWSSQFSDNEWLYVDLGSTYTIERVVLWWEAAYARGYKLQVSSDAGRWSEVSTTTTGDGGVDDISLSSPASGRYLRLLGTQRATLYGYSLYELEVYGGGPINHAPVVSSFSKSGTQDTPLSFAAGDFAGAFTDPDAGDTLQTIQIVSLPGQGVLTLAGSPVTVGQEIPVGQIGTLMYTPGSGYTGPDSFLWNGSDGRLYAATEGAVNLSIQEAVANLAWHRPAAASTSYYGYSPANATDGNGNSRWSSQFSDNEWISVDLGSVYTITRVVLRWETAYARSYQLQVSSDASSWSDVYNTTTGDGAVDDITLASPALGRYVRMLGTQRGTVYGYSLYELEVYGRGATNSAPAVSSFSKGVMQDTSLVFTAADFTAAFVDRDAGDSLQKIRITSLPSHGVLTPTGTVVTVDQEIGVGQLDMLLYTPSAGYTGSDSFGWNGSDGALYAVREAAVNLSIQTLTANLALHKPVVASTSYYGYPPVNATDGNSSSRWSSQFTDNEWIYVDLGSVYTIARVVLRWETAYGRGYQIQVSNDASSWSEVYRTSTGDGAVDEVTLAVPVWGRYVRMLGTERGTAYGYSLYEFEVYGGIPAPVNVALGKTVEASTSYSGYPAGNVTDGDASSRWSSAFSDSQWIYVDLGAVYTIHQVVLRWEAAYGRGYKLQVSSNTFTWSDVYSTSTGDGGVDDITLASPVSGRYVRLLGTQRATAYGYSLWEFEVYG